MNRTAISQSFRHALPTVAALALVAAAGTSARAAIVKLDVVMSGQTLTFTGQSYLAVGTQDVTSFAFADDMVSVSGDVVTKNTGGNQLDLKITNVHYEVLHGHDTQVYIEVLQDYETPVPLSWTATHGVTGFCDGIEFEYVAVECIHDDGGANVSLPGLLAYGQPNGTLSDGPYSAVVNQASSSKYTIRTVMELYSHDPIFDVFIDLPGSYETTAVPVPAPAASAFLSLLPLAAVARRRR